MQNKIIYDYHGFFSGFGASSFNRLGFQYGDSIKVALIKYLQIIIANIFHQPISTYNDKKCDITSCNLMERNNSNLMELIHHRLIHEKNYFMDTIISKLLLQYKH